MLFNGIDLTEYLRIKDISGRGLSPSELDLIDVPGMDGAYFQDKKKPVRPIEIEANIKADNRDELRVKIDKLNGILSVNEPVPISFFDEPNMTYYGIPQETGEDNEFTFMHEGLLTIICPDPYKYAPEKEGTSGFQNTVTNEGTADAYPVFELNVLAPITFAMIQNQDDEYIMIGEPADDDIQAVDTRETVLYENGSTVDEWTATENRDFISDDSNITSLDGIMGNDDAGIRLDSYGTPGDRQRGAVIYKELDNAIQDFVVESTFDINSRFEHENWRMMIYLLDENMNNIGHIGLKNNSRLQKRRVPLAQLGRHLEGVTLLGDSSPRIDNAPDLTLFYLRFKREGDRFSVYMGHWRNNRHDTSWEEEYRDVDSEYLGKLKYISLFIGSYQDRSTPSRLRINSVEVSELSTAVEDQTPYIAREGDTIIFDHQNEEMLLNGEDVTRDKDFGSSYFKLKKGENTLIMYPDDDVEGTLRYRERYV